MLYDLYIVVNLGFTACADEHACHLVLTEHPRESELRETLVPAFGDFLKSLNGQQLFFRDVFRFQEVVARGAAVSGNTVQIAVCQQSLL